MAGAKLSRVFTLVFTAALAFTIQAGSATAQELATAKENPTTVDKEEALTHLRAGAAFYRDPSGPRCEEAYPEFRKAYELSGSLNALLNLGTCATLLELDGEAVGYYERFIDKKGEDIDAEDKAHVDRDLLALRSAVAWVTLSSDRPTGNVSDQRTPRSGPAVRNRYPIGLSNRRFGIHPGAHVFTATTEGFGPQTWTVDIKNGATYAHEFVFDKNAPVTADGMNPDELLGRPAPTPKPDGGEGADEGGSRPVPVSVWVVGGITLASAGVMGAMMGVASSKKSTYDSEILGVKPIAEQEEAQADIETFNLLSDVFIGVTAAGAATTLILFLTRPTVEDSADSDAAGSDGGPAAAASGYRVDWMLAPAIGPRGGGIMFTGSF